MLFSSSSLYYHDASQNKNYIKANKDLFDENDPKIKSDVLRIIGQYLDNNGFNASKTVLYDEANIKKKKKNDYLSSMALSVLTKRLKPLERHQTFAGEFRDLSYLLTSKSIQDTPLFKNWDGIVSSRQKLADDLQQLLELEIGDQWVDNIHVPENRLSTLLYQAVAYQVYNNKYHTEHSPTVNTLLQDYEPPVLPNKIRSSFVGHKANVKCVTFIGEDGDYIASGSSDNTIKIWDVEKSQIVCTLNGHTSRIWDLCVDKSGSTLFSASGDKTVKIWDIRDINAPTLIHTISESNGDVYGLNLHPLESHIVFGGYDKTIKLYDLVVGRVVQTFDEHELSVSSALISPLGNLLISGSKDHTVKFWDIMSGTVVNNIKNHLGEVTSVSLNSSSTQILTSAKDNSNRLWDLRTLKPLCKYKGHQNTSKNFIRSNFMNNSLITGGSEDGKVYIWNKDTGDIVINLEGHKGIVYEAKWHTKQGLLCSASDDNTLITWWYN
ncbi:WD repeat-containing protein 5B [Smittium mucronatum]|uniref:WD40 repeat-containing protein SMU1 n=1 Tax=Smittium mucronatum TaxID=133383 RepID=A0A1R0H0Q7_9FUNG|nr:WD repeat-containing protein 5B [Smittium mucronatum]